jgi:hypothetical protein
MSRQKCIDPCLRVMTGSIEEVDRNFDAEVGRVCL